MTDIAHRCPSGLHDLEGPWVKFCPLCSAYIDDIAFLIERGVEPLEATRMAQRNFSSMGQPLRRGQWAGTAAGQEALFVAEGDELEETIRERVTDFLRQMGMAVYKLEQGYRPENCQKCDTLIPVRGTRVTAGVADILVAPPGGALFFVEFKRPKRRAGGDYVSNRTPEQVKFAADCAAAGVQVYLWRSLKEAQAWFSEWRKSAGRGSNGQP